MYLFFNKWHHVPICQIKKVIRKMKLSIFFSIVSILCASAVTDSYSQIAKLSLNLKEVTVEEALDVIKQQSEYSFWYRSGEINLNRKVSVSVNEQNIYAVLNKVFADQEVSYFIDNNHVIIYKSPQSADGKTIQQEGRKVTGVVADDTGASMPGVNVVLKGTTIGVVTDIQGRYSINVPNSESILVFSFIGYESIEENAGGRQSINVTLSEITTELDEVVVIGYGTVKKRDLTGSVASVTSKDFAHQPVISSSQALLGRAAGVTVNTTMGAPGEGDKIRIRGNNSLNGSNAPLCVVDGYFGDINMVHPSDIQSVEVLKDASATAIYGSRGANGVIIITTKRGDQSKPKITITSNIGYSKLPESKKYDLLNAGEYAKFINEYDGLEYYTQAEIQAFERNGGTDWQDEIFQTGVIQDYQVSVAGGGNKVRYYLSGNYTDQTGIITNTDWSRYAFRANIDAELSKKFDLGVSMYAQKTNKLNAKFGEGRDKTTSSIWQSIIWSPTESIYEADGSYNTHDMYGSTGLNPVMLSNAPELRNINSSIKIIGDLKYKIIDGLTFNLIGTIGQSANEFRSFQPKTMTTDTKDNAEREYDTNVDWQINALLNYSKTFAGKHNVSAMLGFEESSYESNSFRAIAGDLALVSNTYYNLGLARSKNISSGYGNGALRSFFGRANYNYASKYFFTATYRADGTSRLSKENRFEYFPSMAIAWRASEEDFINDLGIFDNLKFRGSWGQTGSQAFGSYKTMSALGTTNFRFPPGETSNTAGYSVRTPGNEDLQWERTTQIDVGVDMSFFNSRLSLSLDYFIKNTDRLLTNKQLPKYAGGGSTLFNFGEVENKGFEANINYMLINRSDFQWNVNLNGFTMQNKVLNTGEQERLEGDTFASGVLSSSPFIIMKGEPIGSIFGYKYLGLWKTSEAAQAQEFGQNPGDSRYEDLDGNKEYGANDYQVIGHSAPKFSWGFNNTVFYKNFELNVMLQGVHGNDILNLTYATAGSVVDMSRTITLKEATNRWTPNNQDAEWAAKSTTSKTQMNSSQWIQDGSYVKLRNLSLSYYLSPEIIKIGGLKLSISVQNLFTITKYKGYDPEVSSVASSLAEISSGLDFGVYPTARTFTFGATLDF